MSQLSLLKVSEGSVETFTWEEQPSKFWELGNKIPVLPLVSKGRYPNIT